MLQSFWLAAPKRKRAYRFSLYQTWFLFGFVVVSLLFLRPIFALTARGSRGAFQHKSMLASVELSRFVDNCAPYVPIKSWAQDHEDIVLDYALFDVEDGTYVDVGANDPTEISVTKAFYDRNWRGINIEPLSDKYLLLMQKRPEDLNLNIACGSERSVLMIWPHEMITTLDSTLSWTRGVGGVPIQVYPLSEVLRNYSLPVCHFCKIDVEGFEKQVLLGINWTSFRPWIFCIEATIPMSITPCHNKWEYILLEHQYAYGCAIGINRFYYDAVYHPYLRKRLLCRPGSAIPKDANASCRATLTSRIFPLS
jgi:FkbM family methyltransferase